jgi:hypothetical protein
VSRFLFGKVGNIREEHALASDHPIAPNPASNGTGAIRNLFLDRDRAADGVELTDGEGAHARVRQPTARRDGARAHVIPTGEIADPADAGARVALVVPLGRPPAPSWGSRLRSVVAELRDSALALPGSACARGRRACGVAVMRGLALLLIVIVAVAVLVQRDSARAARDDARRQLAAAEQSTARLSHANRVLSRERDGAVAAARDAAREQSRAAAATRRWRRIATQRRGHANRERRKRR